MAEKTFYTEICEASTLEQEKEVCEKYQKNFKTTRACIDSAMKAHMMSSSSSRELFHRWIVDRLKAKNL